MHKKSKSLKLIAVQKWTLTLIGFVVVYNSLQIYTSAWMLLSHSLGTTYFTKEVTNLVLHVIEIIFALILLVPACTMEYTYKDKRRLFVAPFMAIQFPHMIIPLATKIAEVTSTMAALKMTADKNSDGTTVRPPQTMEPHLMWTQSFAEYLGIWGLHAMYFGAGYLLLEGLHR